MDDPNGRTAHTGVFNAVGPKSRLTMREMLEGIASAVKRRRRPRPSLPILNSRGRTRTSWPRKKVSPWGDMPVWAPAGRLQRLRRNQYQQSPRQGFDLPHSFRHGTSHTPVVSPTARPAQAKLRAGLTADAKPLCSQPGTLERIEPFRQLPLADAVCFKAAARHV